MKLEAQGENVSVFARFRPSRDDDSHISLQNEDTSLILKRDFEKRNFTFNQIFKENNTQERIFKTVAEPVLESVLNGWNGSILAYGQTGTGKTFTMIGKNDGFLPQSIRYLLEKGKNGMIKLSFSALQIYNEQEISGYKIFPKDVKINQLPNLLVTKEIESMDNFSEVLETVERLRWVGSTTMNIKSSRSHAIFMLDIFNFKKNTNSTLYLVDLAGSERIKKSNVSGDKIDETIAINTSLTTLGKWIIALGDKKGTHVPFRESKLTKILQEALGGNNKTSLVITLSPELDDLEETISSLFFGQRAKKVQWKPIVQESKTSPKSIIDELKKQLEVKNSLLQEISDENKALQLEMRSGAKELGTQRKDEYIKQLELKIKILKKDHQSKLEDMDAIMLQQEREINKLRDTVTQITSGNKTNNELKIPETSLLKKNNSLAKGETQSSQSRLHILRNLDNKENYSQNQNEMNSINEMDLILVKETLEKEKMELISDKEKIGMANGQLNKKIKEMEDELMQLKKANIILVKENDGLIVKQRNKPHTSLLDEKIEEISLLKQEIKYLKEMVGNMENENQILEEEIQILKSDGYNKEFSKSESYEDNALKNELQKTVNDFKENLQSVTNQNNYLSEENENLKIEINNLKDQNSSLYAQLTEIVQREKPSEKHQDKSKDSSRSNAPQSDRRVITEDLEKERIKWKNLEEELEIKTNLFENQLFQIESLNNDRDALEAQLRISKIQVEELSEQNSKLESQLKRAERSYQQSSEELLAEISEHRKLYEEAQNEKKKIREKLIEVKKEREITLNMIETSKKEEHKDQTSLLELERFKHSVFDFNKENFSDEEKLKELKLMQEVQNAKNMIKEYVQQSDWKSINKNSSSKEILINSLSISKKESFSKSIYSRISQLYFWDLEAKIKDSKTNEKLLKVLGEEFKVLSKWVKDLSSNFESVLWSLIESELLLKAQEESFGQVQKQLDQFKNIVKDPLFEDISVHFFQIWANHSQKAKSIQSIQRFFKQVIQKKKTLKLHQKHKSQYELFQAGSGKNLVQLLVKKTEDAICSLYEHFAIYEDELKLKNKKNWRLTEK